MLFMLLLSRLLSLLFILTIPRPLTSSLFPYTTLFRSFSLVLFCATMLTAEDGRLTVSPINAETVDVAVAVDRKSTRLNSSHRCISYAVFCLKKKIIKDGINTNHLPTVNTTGAIAHTTF